MTPRTFSQAVSNWCRVLSDEADIPRMTCGSAERMYASHPERNTTPDEPMRFVDRRAAERFEALVARLEPDLRLAWHLQHGFRNDPTKTPEWISEHSTKARAQLSVWWSLSPR